MVAIEKGPLSLSRFGFFRPKLREVTIEEPATTDTTPTLISYEPMHRRVMGIFSDILQQKPIDETQELPILIKHLIESLGASEAQRLIDVITGSLNLEKSIALHIVAKGKLPVVNNGQPLDIHQKNITELTEYVTRRNDNLQGPAQTRTVRLEEVLRLYQLMQTPVKDFRQSEVFSK